MKFGPSFSNYIESKKKGKVRSSLSIYSYIAHPALKKSKIVDKKALAWRILPFYILILFVGIVFIARLFSMQIINYGKYLSLSEQNRVRTEIIRANRGVIVDEGGNIIARNKPGFRIAYDLTLKEPLDGQIIQEISKDLDISIDFINDSINKSLETGLASATLKKGVTKDEALLIESKYAKSTRITVETSPIRDNLYPKETAHVVGYVGEISKIELDTLGKIYVSGDTVGKLGVEEYYEKYLHGKNGSIKREYDSRGLSLSLENKTEAIFGDTLVLYLNINLQKAIYDILESSSYKAGAVLVQDINNGGIVSLVSFPSYDSNLFNSSISELDYNNLINDPLNPLFNRAIAGQYAPGSTFKIVTASAAIAEKVIDPYKLINVPGSISVGTYVYKDWRLEGHGICDMQRAISVSSDVYFYALGGGYAPFGVEGLGIEKLYLWGKNFGFGEPLGIDMLGEESGNLPTQKWKEETYGEPWYLGDSYISAIGQGYILATPLQLNSMTLAVANGGVLYEPRVAKSIISFSSKNQLDFPINISPKVIRKNFLPPQIVDILHKGMLGACSQGGTAYTLFDFEPKVACKTGTSEFGVKDSLGNYKTHAWITLFAPYNNPKYALTVFLEEGGGGSDNAGEIARKILDWMVKYEYIP